MNVRKIFVDKSQFADTNGNYSLASTFCQGDVNEPYINLCDVINHVQSQCEMVADNMMQMQQQMLEKVKEGVNFNVEMTECRARWDAYHFLLNELRGLF